MPETYVSVDVEADGPIPGQNSMLSLGAAAYHETGKELDTFSVNLETLEGASADEKSSEFWREHQEAWRAHRKDTVPPATAMAHFAAWLRKLENPVLLAAPAAFDLTFLRCYLVRFLGTDRLWHNGIDLRSYAMGVLHSPYRGAFKSKIREAVPEFPGSGAVAHTHVALDDAREQAAYFFALKRRRAAMEPDR